MERLVIINADDFGLCQGVNKAVAEAHTKGVLTSATIMANMPAAQEAVKIAKQLPTLGVGVHLNLFKGRPLSNDPDVEWLLNAEGKFNCSWPKLAILSTSIHKLRKAIKAEFTAQIQWLIDHGLHPTHLDSHGHIHCFPAVFGIVCRLAKHFGIGAVRWCFEPKGLRQLPWPLPAEGTKKMAGLLRTLARINRMQDSGLLQSDALFGVTHAGKIDAAFLKAVALYNSASVAEVMTHPGLLEGLDPKETSLVQQRKLEFEALCSEKTRQHFEEAQVRLVHYGQL